jgi:hypothetical protein
MATDSPLLDAALRRPRSGGTGQVLPTLPGGCVLLTYHQDEPGRARLALPRLHDVARLLPRWRLDRYPTRLADGQEMQL